METLFKVGPIFFPEGCLQGNQYRKQKKSEADLLEAAEGSQSLNATAFPEYGLENTEIGILPSRKGLEVHQLCSVAKRMC